MSSKLNLVEERIWNFGRSDLPDHYGSMVFREDGRIGGYLNRREHSWRRTEDALQMTDPDGTVTSEFRWSDYHQARWLGTVFDGSTRLDVQHRLSVNHSHPVRINFFRQIEELATEGGFFLSHFGGRQGVYRDDERIDLYPRAFIEPGATLPRGAIFRMGAFSYQAGSASMNLSVGRFCSIAHGVSTFADAHPVNWLTTNPIAYSPLHGGLYQHMRGRPPPHPRDFDGSTSHIVTVLGNDVWIGADCLLKPGISIGDGAIVAARSVVTKDVAPYTIVAGVPATPRRLRFEERIIERLLRLRWWELDIARVSITWDDVDRSLDAIEEARARGDITETYPSRDWSLEIIKNYVL